MAKKRKATRATTPDVAACDDPRGAVLASSVAVMRWRLHEAAPRIEEAAHTLGRADRDRALD